jgi:hypothetical protein
MGKHIGVTSRGAERRVLPRAAWCPGKAADEFCYSFEIEDGVFGLLVTGGFAGVHRFKPISTVGGEQEG